MKLCDCEYGKLVCTLDTSGEILEIGMIVGITNNRDLCTVEDKKGVEYAIPLVKFSCSPTARVIHYANITDYKKHCRGW